MITNETSNQAITNPIIRPQNLKELRHLADMIHKSDICPKDIKGKPDEVFLRIYFGLEVGLTPLQAISNVAIINGKATIYGDAMLGLVQRSKVYDWHKIEELGAKDHDEWGYKCTVKRKGQDPYAVTFTKKDAIRAQLWNKQGPWSQYPQRMLKFKAIGFALRDIFPDVLKGFISYEEAIDYPNGQEKKEQEGVTVDGEVIKESKTQESCSEVISDYKESDSDYDIR